MLKRSLLLTLGIAALAAMCWSDAAVAKLTANGISLGNGLNLPNGIDFTTTTLRAVRLAMPDGTEVNFR